MTSRAAVTTLFLAITIGSVADAITVRDVIFTTKDAGTVTFSHQRHLQQPGLANNCKACHDRFFPIKHRVRHTMAAMAHGKSCGACHNSQSTFGLQECSRCHAVRTITIPVKATGPVHFSHQQHLTATPDCKACHPGLFAAGRNQRGVTMKAMQAGSSCGACHNGSKAFPLDNCAACHPTRDVVFKTKGAGNTLFSHQIHIQSARCDACHPRLYPIGKRSRTSMAQMEKGRSCGACHNGRAATALSACGTCHLMKDKEYGITGAGNVQFGHQQHLKTAKSCTRCHPGLYPLGKRTKPVTMQEMNQGKSCGACHNGKNSFTVKENCARCHHVQEQG